MDPCLACNLLVQLRYLRHALTIKTTQTTPFRLTSVEYNHLVHFCYCFFVKLVIFCEIFWHIIWHTAHCYTCHYGSLFQDAYELRPSTTMSIITPTLSIQTCNSQINASARVQCDFERSGLGSNTYVLPGHDPRNRNWKFRLFDQGVETGMAWLIQHEWRPSSAGLFIIPERGGVIFLLKIILLWRK